MFEATQHLADSHPRLSLPDEQDATTVPCHECQKQCNPDESAEIRGNVICPKCLDPKQPAFDYAMAAIEWQEETIRGLRAENRQLRYSCGVATRGLEIKDQLLESYRAELEKLKKGNAQW